jgi:hypothetical protein
VACPDTMDEIQREQLAAFRLADPSFTTTYRPAQDILVMMRKLEGGRLDAWLAQVHESRRARKKAILHWAWSEIKPLYKPA